MVALGRQAHVDQAVSGALYNKACVYALMGQAESAVAAARQAVAAGYTNYTQFAADSDFETIRRHPAWVRASPVAYSASAA